MLVKDRVIMSEEFLCAECNYPAQNEFEFMNPETKLETQFFDKSNSEAFS
jgi:hypothetical protein